MNNINTARLFNASCIALVTTSMTFAIRAGMLDSWRTEFNLSYEEVGVIASMAFYGFPVATILGGIILDSIGMGRMLAIAWACHLAGLVLTIFAGGFWTLLISTFLVGFANGSVEAACNPMVASLYTDRKTTMLNKFHVWFPGGIVIGAVLGYLMGEMGLGWRLQCAIILIPMLVYGYMFYKQAFPRTERVEKGITSAQMISAVFANPLFYFITACMLLTANTELSTGQWIQSLLKSVVAAPLLVLAFINGIMALGRFYAGPVVHRLNPAGMLLGSAIISAVGLFALAHAEGWATWGAAAVFAIGVCYFWPTMIGFVSEYIPDSGALGLSLIGGAGMLATAMFQPIIGKWFDNNLAEATARGLSGEEASLIAGQATLSNVGVLPIILIVAFGGLWFFMRGRK
ncbi:MAG: MFS transporter [Saprospiraceae bacterium]|nr:MFS transporter [Saprospiraceae bacterium]